MARGINKVILVGNLGGDPELKYTGNGTALCTMSLATNESYKDADGNWIEKTEWHRVVAWSRLAEICAEYLKKGSQVYFEGSIQTRSWEDQDGQTRYMTEIKAREMMMLGGRDDAGGAYDQRASSGGARQGSNSGGQRQGQRPAQPAQRQSQQPQAAQQGGDDYTFEPDDDLPF